MNITISKQWKPNGKIEQQYGGVVIHNGGGNAQNSEAFIIEYAYARTNKR